MKTEMKLPVGELKSALPGFGKIIPKKHTLPILGGIKLSLDKEAQLVRLEATNLDEVVELRIEHPEHGRSGEVVIPFEELASVVKGCSGADVIRVVAEGERTVIQYPVGGKYVDKPVDRLDRKEWPVMPTVNGKAIPLAEEFKETLKQAIECASTDDSRYIINGACLDVRLPSAHYVVGTNGTHLFSANSFDFKLDASVLVPSKRFITWTGFTVDGSWSLRTLNHAQVAWLRVDSNHWSYTSRQLQGDYPNWKQVVPVLDPRWTKVVLDEESAEVMLGAIPMLPGGRDFNHPVELLAKADGLTVVGRDSTGRQSEAPITGVNIVGNPVGVALDRLYLLKALRFGFREINILDPLTPLVFSMGGKTMVVMPLRNDAVLKWTDEQSPKSPPPETTEATSPPAPLEEENQSSVADPSGAEPHPTVTEERKPMESTMPAPQRGALKSHEPASENAIDELLQQVEKVKDDLRNVFSGLNETERLLKKAAREHKATEKEINRVRSSLRTLQNVEI